MSEIISPSPTSASWYYAQDGRPVGPFDRSTLQAMEGAKIINGETLVCSAAGGEWLPLSKLLNRIQRDFSDPPLPPIPITAITSAASEDFPTVTYSPDEPVARNLTAPAAAGNNKRHRASAPQTSRPMKLGRKPPLLTTLGCVMAATYPIWWFIKLHFDNILNGPMGNHLFFFVLGLWPILALIFSVLGLRDYLKDKEAFRRPGAVWGGLIIALLLFSAHFLGPFIFT